MIIGIDGNEANTEKRVGVHMYTYELLWAIYNLDNDSNKYVIYLKNPPREDLPKEKANWHYKILPGRGVWIITRLMPHLFVTNFKPDVFFTPSHYIPPFAPMPRVCSIMDLGYLDFSGHLKRYDYWQLRLWSAYSIYVAKCIFAISDATKKDIVRHYKVRENKITITPLAYDRKKFHTNLSLSQAKGVAVKYGINGDYVLFISTLKPSKNIKGLVDAWEMVAKRFPRVKLVVAGKKGWMYEDIFRKVRAKKLEKHIIFTDFVAEEDKPYLIKGAKAFVMPSFWEGFGLDPLYAMATGVPVIVSNKGSLPEVVGDAGLFVDPNNIDSISDSIINVLEMDQKAYNSLVAKGLRQAEKFSWEETARKTIVVLEKIAKK